MMPPARPERRKILERTWILVGFAYSLFRVFVANVTVRKYGVNIWAFAVVEIGSSFPYSLGTARLVTSLIDHNYRSALRWGTLAAVCFFAPEAFIVARARRCGRRHPGRCPRMPREVYGALGILLIVVGSLAVWGVIRKVRQAHAQHAADRAASGEH